MHAMMLSFFKGDKLLGENVKDISELFGIKYDDAMALVSHFINNEKEIHIKYDNTIFAFPERMIIENEQSSYREDIDIENFFIDPPYDFKTTRSYKPKDAVLVINTHCATDCIYCYANKNHVFMPLATERILGIIDEAKAIGMNSFDVSGGELLLHKDWNVILKHLVDNGFDPYISTKVPLDERMVEKLSLTGIKQIQVSLDTLDTEKTRQNLNVGNGYVDKIKKSLKLLDSSGIDLIIKGTLTRYTLTEENLHETLDFITSLKHVKRYIISTIGYMHFKPNVLFSKLHPTLTQIETAKEYVKKMSELVPFEMYLDNQSLLRKQMCNQSEFNDRSTCSANVNGFVILPDGKVTICEELYWNPQFIIGDLKTQTIMELWSSEKAWNLWNLQQSIFPKESACSICEKFDECRHGAGVCWKMVIGAYGKENAFYPDPRCPHAPEIKNNICYD